MQTLSDLDNFAAQCTGARAVREYKPLYLNVRWCSQYPPELATLRAVQIKFVEFMTHLTSSVVAKYRFCAFLLVLLTVPLSGIAGISDEQLYTVQQPVDDQSQSNRQQAARQALLEVLSRVTGLGTIPRNQQISNALAQPDRFYSEYVFVRSDNAGSQDGAAALALEVRFQEQAILELVRAARLPIWWSGRPLSMAWMVVEQNGQRSLLRDGGPLELGQALQRQARKRGLPVALPLLDLQDNLQVSPGIVWGNFLPTLIRATDRYGINQLVVGRMRAQSVGDQTLYSGDWQVAFAEDLVPVTINFSGLSAEQAANVATELATSYFAPAMTVFAGDQFDHTLHVDEVTEIAQYARMMKYFRQFEFVEEVTVASIVDGKMALNVSTAASAKLLLSLLTRDGRLATQASEDYAAVPSLLWRD
ncbi:MAG TPA: hypothetical protein DCL88_03975 [Gammaproteobacteria bacterium]|nr:hypothetical protein [Gammaproteobacteria bacterium]